MKIGPFHITRTRKTASGLIIYPWQALTEDRVAPELRQIVAKVARSEVKSFLQEVREADSEGGCPNQGTICQAERLCSVCPRAKEGA